MFFSLCDLHIDSLAERNVAQTKTQIISQAVISHHSSQDNKNELVLPPLYLTFTPKFTLKPTVHLPVNWPGHVIFNILGA